MFQALSEGERHPAGWRCRMIVCGQPEARRNHAEWGPTHVLSIKGTKRKYFGPKGLPDGHHLIVEFHDTEDDGHEDAPRMAHFDEIFAWTDRLPPDARLVVHCAQGMHRSCAVALGLLAQQMPPLRAGYLLHTLRPMGNPNRLMVRMIEEKLALPGALMPIAGKFPCEVWRHGDGLGNFPHRRRKTPPA